MKSDFPMAGLDSLSGPPQVFHFNFQFWASTWEPHDYRWEQGILHYKLRTVANDSSLDWKREKKVSDEEWNELWRICNEVNVWAWPKHLSDPKVVIFDGCSVFLNIRIQEKEIYSRGHLSDDRWVCDGFYRLHDAMQRLVGWEPHCRRPR